MRRLYGSAEYLSEDIKKEYKTSNDHSIAESVSIPKMKEAMKRVRSAKLPAGVGKMKISEAMPRLQIHFGVAQEELLGGCYHPTAAAHDGGKIRGLSMGSKKQSVPHASRHCKAQLWEAATCLQLKIAGLPVDICRHEIVQDKKTPLLSALSSMVFLEWKTRNVKNI